MEPKYLLKAKETYRFHREKLLANDRWTSSRTAQALRKSIGGISEDLLIARWSKTHENALMKFKYAKDAIEFIREKQREQDLEKLE